MSCSTQKDYLCIYPIEVGLLRCCCLIDYSPWLLYKTGLTKRKWFIQIPILKCFMLHGVV